jgi:hypothetical protein
MDSPLVHLVVSLEHTGNTLQTGALFSLKKLFPLIFRRATGCSGADGNCTRDKDCPCVATFSQELAVDPSALRRFQKPPLPFAFTLPPPSERRKGDRVELRLTVVGTAVSYLDIYLQSLRLLFSPGGNPWRLQLAGVSAIAADGTVVALPVSGTTAGFAGLPLLSFRDFMVVDRCGTGTVTLKLVTPLRIIHEGQPLRQLPFSSVAGVLFRRISSLAYYYGGIELDLDFKWLARQSRAVVCRNADLSWSNLGGGVQGVTGTVMYEGDLDEFLPFLRLGELLNIGKGAAYGMGNYRLKM